MVKYIGKANDDVLSHCQCEQPLASLSGQMDCPWCGCGWMISCLTCGKAFIFARVIEIDASYDALARLNFEQKGLTATDTDISECATEIRDAMATFEVGDIIIYLDGPYFRVDATDVEFEGLYANHKLDRLPHAVALEKPGYLFEVLTDPNYWYEREREGRLDGPDR